MSVQTPRVYPATIATGASLSAGIDLKGGFLYTSLEIPAYNATVFSGGATPVYIQGSSDGTNFRRLTEIYTNTVANTFQIASSVSNAIVPLNAFNLQFIKVEVSGTVSGAGGAIIFKIISTDSL